MSAFTWIESLVRDLRFGARMLRRSAGFALTAIGTLALAIGINAAVLGIVDATFLRPLPYPQPDRLALVARTYVNQTGDGDASNADARSVSQDGFTWEIVRDEADRFRAAPFSDWTTGVNLAAGDAALYVRQQRVGAGFFAVLGTPPAIGREFTELEDVPDGPPVVVLAHDRWQRSFGGDRGVLGTTILLRGEPYTVVGVMAPGFRSTAAADLWTPLQASTSGEGGGTNYAIIARLENGATWAEANGEAASLAPAVNAATPAGYPAINLSLMPFQEGMGAPSVTPLRLLATAVAIVFIVACVNIAGLLLVRGDRRRAEIATRLAIGGSRAAVVRQLIAEGFVLAAAAGAAGTLVAAATLWLFRDLGAEVLGAWQPVGFDVRVLGVVAVLALLTAVMFAIVPALLAQRMDGQAALASRGLRSVAGPSSRLPRRAMLIGQVALAVVLLAGAGVLLRSYLHLISLEPGFDPTDVHSVRVSFEDARYGTRAQVDATLREGLSRVANVPGVVAAGASLGLPYERLLNLGFKLLEGDLEIDTPITNLSYVTPGYLETLRVPLVQGRSVDDADVADATPVAVVNEAFAREYLTDGWTVGRHIAVGGAEREIIGVVASTQQSPGWGQYEPLRPPPLVYVPVAQASDEFLRLVHGWFQPAWVVRLAGPGVDRRTVEAAFASVDPLLPLAHTASIAEVRSATLAPQRLLAGLLSAMAAAAVFLAALGIHGLVAASVNERTREMGIRLALGATPAETLRAVATPGVVLAAIGAAIGCLAALGSTRILAAMIWGVSAVDPTTYALVVLLLLLVAAVASFVPARRVLRMDPASSLRAE